MAELRKIIITGGSGKLGRYVVRDLAAHYEVKVVDVVTSDHSAPSDLLSITDLPAVIDALRGFDAVVHLAALDSVVCSEDDKTLNTNCLGTWNVLHAAEQQGISKVIIMSSEAGLGMEYLDSDPPPLYLPIDETHPFRPSDSYGLSKQLCEHIGQHFARRGKLSVVCIRPTEIAFPEIVHEFVGLLEAAQTSGPVTATRSTADQFALPISRAYVRADDMVRLIRLSLEATGEPYEVFWANAADTCDSAPTLTVLKALYGSLPEIRRPELYEANPRAGVFDISRAQARLGWEPTGDWAQLVNESTSKDRTEPA